MSDSKSAPADTMQIALTLHGVDYQFTVSKRGAMEILQTTLHPQRRAMVREYASGSVIVFGGGTLLQIPEADYRELQKISAQLELPV